MTCPAAGDIASVNKTAISKAVSDHAANHDQPRRSRAWRTAHWSGNPLLFGFGSSMLRSDVTAMFLIQLAAVG